LFGGSQKFLNYEKMFKIILFEKAGKGVLKALRLE
jgi:hypothetical protein